MRCIVTCGPTYEPLDQVRRLTNFSTGTLGVQLANYLTERGHDVILLKGYYSITPEQPLTEQVEVFTTTDDLAKRIKKHSGTAFGAVFHAAAVSDFGFGQVYLKKEDGKLVPVQAGKFATRGEPLLVQLEPTIKILPQLRSWFPKAFLVGWKYEVDGDRSSALQKSVSQLANCDTDASVVNGQAYGKGFGLLHKHGLCLHCQNHHELYQALTEAITKAQATRGAPQN